MPVALAVDSYSVDISATGRIETRHLLPPAAPDQDPVRKEGLVAREIPQRRMEWKAQSLGYGGKSP